MDDTPISFFSKKIQYIDGKDILKHVLDGHIVYLNTYMLFGRCGDYYLAKDRFNIDCYLDDKFQVYYEDGKICEVIQDWNNLTYQQNLA